MCPGCRPGLRLAWQCLPNGRPQRLSRLSQLRCRKHLRSIHGDALSAVVKSSSATRLLRASRGQPVDPWLA
jgi:hypothetical protein